MGKLTPCLMVIKVIEFNKWESGLEYFEDI